MRKMDPTDVKGDFQTSLVTLNSFYTATSAALSLDSQRTFMTENTLMAAAVLWEGFISDLLVAYINRDATRFRMHLKDALEHGLTTKQATILERYAPLNIPTHLSKAEIQELVDRSGNNITFSNFGALIDQTKVWLVQADADKFKSRSAKEKAVVNALIAVRNHLAHRSERSHRAMNETLSLGVLQTTGLRRGQRNINHVGAYLKAIVPKKNVTRLEVFLAELHTLAGTL